MSYVGINVGALTVKVAAVKDDAKAAKVAAHRGRALEVLHELHAAAEFADAEYFGVSGRLGHISEVAAIQRASARTVAPLALRRTRTWAAQTV